MWQAICWPNLQILKTRFSEYCRRTKRTRKIDNFLYRHFKQTNHSTSSISIQPIEKITYGDNSTKRYRNILMHELELKWIKSLQTPLPLGFNYNIYHEGNISRLPDFDGFSLLDIRKRNKRSHGKRKNGNLKRKNKHVLTLSELSIFLKHSCRHMAFPHLVTHSISSLRKANRAHRHYDSAILTRCYTQHALRPYIDSEINHIRHFIKIQFVNKGIEFINLPSIFKDKSVIFSIPTYFENKESPIICYKYNKPIRSTVFTYNKLVTELDIENSIPDS